MSTDLRNMWISAYGITVAEVRRRYPPARDDVTALTTYVDGSEVLRYVSSGASHLGLRSGMTLNEARRISGGLVSIPVPHDAERAVIRRFAGFAGLPCSMPFPDEVLFRFPDRLESPEIIHTIADWVTGTYGISCKTAAAASPLAARIGAVTEANPPCIRPGTERDRFGDIPLSRLPWIDHRNLEILAREWAVFTIGDLGYLPKRLIIRMLGDEGTTLIDLIRSRKTGSNPGNSTRIDLPDPSNNRSEIRRFLLRAVDAAWSRLSSLGVAVRHIHLSIIRCNGRRVSTGRRFIPELEDPLSIGDAAVALLPRLMGRKAIIAVEVDLGAGPAMNSQQSLFPEFGIFRLAGLGRALAEIDLRYGRTAISRASTMVLEGPDRP